MDHVDVAATALLLIETGEPRESVREYLADAMARAVEAEYAREQVTP